jgi:predicted phage terminase large subunit-like protein
MPHLNKELDVIVANDGLCAKCGEPSPLADYCPSCINSLRATAGRRTTKEHGLDPLTAGLAARPDTNPNLMAKQELARRELARRKLLGYIVRMFPNFMPGWFHADLAARLDRFIERVLNQESPRLIINVPPRHGKSIEASQYFPAYVLGRAPELEIITTSHTLSLAIDFSRKTRALVADDRHTQLFPKSMLDQDNRNAAGWKTTAGGGYFPAGVGGAIVGRGAHILIIDDPLKNAEEAASTTVRESVWSWFTTTAYTRLAPGGGVLVIMQRWHLDDLAGRLIRAGNEDDGDVYEVVDYPAIAERDEYRLPDGTIVDYPAPDAQLLRTAGEALHPPRWPLSRLEAIKKTLSPYEWSALYQQRPVVGENALFTEDMFILNEEEDFPERLSMYSTNDLAIGQKQHHDWSVNIAFGVDEDDDIWVVDLIRGRFDALELVDMMIDVHLRHSTLADGIERSQIQMSIGPFFEKRLEERKVTDMNVIELSPGNRDKVARSRSIQGRCRQRKVHLPKNAKWLQLFMNEILAFPVGQNDDQVDAFNWIGLMLDETDVPRIYKKRGRKEESWRDKVKQYQRRSRSGTRSWKTV